MTRAKRAGDSEAALSSQIGHSGNAQRFTVNLSAEIAAQLHEIAARHRVSESSIVEVALRQLLRRVSGEALGVFLRDRGACLRRSNDGADRLKPAIVGKARAHVTKEGSVRSPIR